MTTLAGLTPKNQQVWPWSKIKYQTNNNQTTNRYHISFLFYFLIFNSLKTIRILNGETGLLSFRICLILETKKPICGWYWQMPYKVFRDLRKVKQSVSPKSYLFFSSRSQESVLPLGCKWLTCIQFLIPHDSPKNCKL